MLFKSKASVHDLITILIITEGDERHTHLNHEWLGEVNQWEGWTCSGNGICLKNVGEM